MTYINRILVTLLSFVLLSYLISNLIFKGLFYYSSSSYQKFDEMFNQADDYDVVLIGNSRTHRNIDVRILDSITGKKFYNAGISGAGGFEMYTALKAFIHKHKTTKAVVLNVDNGILNTERGFFNSSFYINSFNNEEIYAAFREKQYPVFFYKYLPFFKMIEFNDDMRNNSIYGLRFISDIYKDSYKGYLPMNESIGLFDTVSYSKSILDYSKNKLKYIDSIAMFCKKTNLKLVFLVTPVYKNHFSQRYSNYTSFLNYLKNEYGTKKGIDIWIFDSPLISSQRKYFNDNIHLSKEGSDFFTTELSKKIRTYFVYN